MTTNTLKVIRQDLLHHLQNSFYILPVRATPLRVIRALLTPEFEVVLWYRFGHALSRRGLSRLAFGPYLSGKRLGADISPQAEIGPGLRIVHSMNIVIGPGVRIGRDAVLFNGVTLGNRLGHHGESGMPVLGDRVLLGTGSAILGPVVIGDDARIGANAVVLRDVPSGATAVGIPARVIRNNLGDPT